MLRGLIALFALLLLLLQYRMWLSPHGVREVLSLEQSVAQQQAQNARLLERNRQLAAEVRDLKQGYAALEERARSDLGMISGNETFYQVVPPTPAASAPLAAPRVEGAAVAPAAAGVTRRPASPGRLAQRRAAAPE